jgi:PPM family protein phosphatase
LRVRFGYLGAVASERRIHLSVVGATDTGLVRDRNEDALLVANALTGAVVPCRETCLLDVSAHPVLLAVSDGMGGERAGEVASEMTLVSLCDALAQRLSVDPMHEALRSAVHKAHDTVRAAATRPSWRGMGATLVAALVCKAEAFVASVGDSRAYLLRGETLHPLTKDHSLLQALLDAGGIAESDVESFPHKNVIVQAIGHSLQTVSILRVELRRGDRILLCTDGLTGELADARIGTTLSKGSVDQACRRLVTDANRCGGGDNVSVLVASVSGDGVREPSDDERRSIAIHSL